MNLKPFLNRNVVMQLRAPWMLVGIDPELNLPTIAMVDREAVMKGQPQDPAKIAPVMQNYVTGKLIERDGELLIQLPIPVSQTEIRKIDLMIIPEAIFSVASVNDDRIVQGGATIIDPRRNG